MQLTNSLYGASKVGTSRPMQDFGLCTADGAYVQTTKARTKGFLVVVFFDASDRASFDVLRDVETWAETIPAAKFSVLGVSKTDRDAAREITASLELKNVTILLDHEGYQARTLGVTNFPTTFVVAGKTGRVLAKSSGISRDDLVSAKETLHTQVSMTVAAEEAAKKAEDEKKAAEAAAKASEEKK